MITNPIMRYESRFWREDLAGEVEAIKRGRCLAAELARARERQTAKHGPNRLERGAYERRQLLADELQRSKERSL